MTARIVVMINLDNICQYFYTAWTIIKQVKTPTLLSIGMMSVTSSNINIY